MIPNRKPGIMSDRLAFPRLSISSQIASVLRPGPRALVSQRRITQIVGSVRRRDPTEPPFRLADLTNQVPAGV